ncbi:hypothetical protein [Pseudomonas sp. LRF_L74]|uniref:hypothetical protein n=1 Tax=Pseudomonas sp. LRF_L74 TaxID=3369422 RepID=UPI003F5DAA77
MNQAPLTLWQVIERLARLAPPSPARIEQTLGNNLRLEAQDEHRTRWVGDEVLLKDNVRIAQTGLTLLTRTRQATVGLFIGGACIGRDALDAQYGELRLVAAPRGRSLNESSVWESAQPWGRLRFSFKESNPECLHSVSIAPSAPGAAE